MRAVAKRRKKPSTSPARIPMPRPPLSLIHSVATTLYSASSAWSCPQMMSECAPADTVMITAPRASYALSLIRAPSAQLAVQRYLTLALLSLFISNKP
jgi:hypothetical protein